MLHPSVQVVVLALTFPSNLQSQTVDTARVRTAFEAVSARRRSTNATTAGSPRSTESGCRMHYLEWGNRDGIPLVWAHGSASSAYEIRAVAPRLVQAELLDLVRKRDKN
jgi:hypothetical protein